MSRYGFNGKENDNEVKGQGNQQDYGMRIYDPRLGRFLSEDPLTKDYPWYTPYQFAGNKPIWAVDLDGKEEFFVTDFRDANGNLYKTTITVVSARGMNTGQQIVHRSQVSFDPAGKATVTYSGSTSGSTTGNNAFASPGERQLALGINATGGQSLTPIPLTNVNVRNAAGVVVPAVANQISYSVVDAANPAYGKSYYNSGVYVGTAPDKLSNSVELNATTASAAIPGVYTGTAPNNLATAKMTSEENAVPYSAAQRTNGLGTEGDKLNEEPTGGSGRVIPNN